MIENGGETLVGENLEQRYPDYESPVSPGGDSMTSSLECDLMIESLQRELDMVRLELEAIVLQETPRAPINTGGAVEGAEETQERCSVRCNATDDMKLLRNGAGAGTKKKTVDTKKIKSQLSWERQQYYINIVNESERERTKTRKRYLVLMEEHISNQMVMLQQKGDKLAQKLQQRLAKDKAMSLPPKPVRTRSNLSLIPRQPHMYKSAFYKAIAKDYTDTKKQQQAPVAKKQNQPTPQLKSPGANGHDPDPTTGAGPDPVANKRGSKCSVKGGAVQGDKGTGGPKHPVKGGGAVAAEGDKGTAAEGDKGTDPSNSWALTSIPPKPITKIVLDTKAPYPDLSPLDNLVSLAKQNEVEETQIRLHLKRMRRLAYARRQLFHMYELSRIHEHMFAASNFVAIEDEVFSSSGRSPTPAASRPLSTKSNDKMLALESVSSSDSSQSPTPPSPALKSSPTHLPKISPTPFLSLDEAMKNSTNIKESKKMSSLWKNYTKNIK